MKHPYNQMVEIVNYPSLYLIDVYEIENVSDANILIHVKNRDEIATNLSIDWDIKLPRQVHFNKYEDIIFLKLFPSNDPYYIRRCITMGYVIKNKITNERTKIRNDEYEKLHKLRGNQSDLLYQYLLLRQSSEVKNYLQYFPENYDLMNSYRNTLHTFTENVYLYYIAINIMRTTILSNVPSCYKQHLYKLHGLYILKKINEPSFKITKKYIIDYVNKLHPSILIISLNKYLDVCYSSTLNY